jgi:peptidyl-prolyl cis-trans isomerase D
MMDGLRRAGKTLVGRIVVAILFGFLILSFGIWGVADMIRNVGHLTVAKVGASEIGVQAYREAYQNELQSLSRRVRRPLLRWALRARNRGGVGVEAVERFIVERGGLGA